MNNSKQQKFDNAVALATAITSFTAAILTMNGTAQKYIHFQAIENEFVFTIFAVMIGIISSALFLSNLK